MSLKLVTCDGGFQIPHKPDGSHAEHLQEIVCQRLLTSEFYLCVRTLDKGGCFVCKTYDFLSRYNIQLLFLMKQFFRVLEVVKPEHSRLVNAERYVVFKDYEPNQAAFEILEKLYSQYTDDNTCHFDIFDENELEKCNAFLKF